MVSPAVSTVKTALRRPNRLRSSLPVTDTPPTVAEATRPALVSRISFTQPLQSPDSRASAWALQKMVRNSSAVKVLTL